MPVHITILGSGSSGNSTYIEYGETRILVDAGFSAKQTRERLASIGRTPEKLNSILVTHEHSDHVNGLGGLAGKLGIPVYCNRLTHEAAENQQKCRIPGKIFATGDSFEIGDFCIESFSIPHDASDPVGFLVRSPDGNAAFLTDLGHATKMVLERVKPANAILLETNHDLKLLQDSSRPWSLKQRIAGRHGHLSNTQAAETLDEIMSVNLKHLYLSHLSRECNRPDIAEAVIRSKLAELGANHVKVEVTNQFKPCATLTLTFQQEQNLPPTKPKVNHLILKEKAKASSQPLLF